ncbi:hypothetical protein [Paucibacter soli]|uniref:hypothetical protein n=1 Tax=Paucibacter soli TaxID=3133433 RepID=UPI00309F2346
MSQSYGSEAPRAHSNTQQRAPARWLVVIESGGYMVARLFLESREPVAEFDASTEETGHMIQGLAASKTAGAPEWDKALGGHSAAERAAADVYLLPV